MNTSLRIDQAAGKLAQWSRFHSRTIWLFTRSDLKTIVVPSTLFAVLYTSSTILSGSIAVNTSPPALLRSLLLTLFWIWLNLLPFTIDNQRQPGSIQEDAENKPWRPLPSKRLTPAHAVALMYFFYAAAVLLSLALGTAPHCLVLIALGACYNSLRGGNSSMLARNLLNGCGYMCFTSGALEVMARGLSVAAGVDAMPWVLVIGAVVSTSIHMMDIPDQIGDRARGRRTIPLVYGDACARWSVAVAVAAWSVYCPAFWQLNVAGFVASMAFGAVVVVKVLGQRTVKTDKKTSLWYNLWIAGLFCLPMVKAIQEAVS